MELGLAKCEEEMAPAFMGLNGTNEPSFHPLTMTIKQGKKLTMLSQHINPALPLIPLHLEGFNRLAGDLFRGQGWKSQLANA